MKGLFYTCGLGIWYRVVLSSFIRLRPGKLKKKVNHNIILNFKHYDILGMSYHTLIFDYTDQYHAFSTLTTIETMIDYRCFLTSQSLSGYTCIKRRLVTQVFYRRTSKEPLRNIFSLLYLTSFMVHFERTFILWTYDNIFSWILYSLLKTSNLTWTTGNATTRIFSKRSDTQRHKNSASRLHQTTWSANAGYHRSDCWKHIHFVSVANARLSLMCPIRLRTWC